MASKEKVQERVYALHDFDAENPDEVSFKAGETILVVEKDDAYGDGWWQGSNQRGETGLFPFSYTTYDRNAAAGIVSGGGAAAVAKGGDDASRVANGKGVKATMDDIDIALARMQAGRGGAEDNASERTGDMSIGETDEDDAEDDYEKRAKARAALAVNAAKNHDDAGEADRAEQARLKAQAVRVFQQEEEKHRQLLLQKEEERKDAAAKGVLPDEKPKAAPIPGVDMSDESDSEGSVGPDIDDAAPTHAPLFGATSAAAGAAGAAAAASSLRPQQSRPLSPIPSDDVHARSKDAGGAKNGSAQLQRSEELEERSGDSSRLSGSPALGKSFGTAPSVGTAPTSLVGNETPRSSHATAVQMSPAPSATGSRGLGPGGDPHEWTVEQVVEWGRSKGWDEPSIVSKFAEHEISGDVLMEMDANILKEIEITAFGKRFQVANAIKELKRSTQDGSQFSTPVVDSSSNSMMQQQQRSLSQPIGERLSSNADTGAFAGLGAPINGLPPHLGQRTTSQQSVQDLAPSPFRSIQPEIHEDSADTYPSTFGSASGDQGGNQDNFRPNSMGSLQGKSSFSPDNSIGYSNFNQQHATSPRRRESGGSSLKSPTERTSFFAGLSGQRNRKPAPRVQGGAAAPSTDGDSNKGTLSRLGFNRLKGSQSGESANPQDLRNKISLPTGSPTFDAMGDTARRHRLSHMAPSNAANIPGFSGHQRQTSVGSGGPGAAEWHTPNEPRSPGNMAPEGAVMVRIRPVDYEGWMRKKGERYNSWKPRYMALKGSDLVLLRDPTAPKIKGYVNMKGYKVIADEATNPGKYGFKILHETEKPHYFSSDDALAVRDWMKALMKATIGRDTSLPVISSYNNATISLKEAQRMNPPPRPPSPTSRARAQRAAARANKDQLTAKDASVLMGLQSPQGRPMGLLLPESSDETNDFDRRGSFDARDAEGKRASRRSASLKRLAPLKLSSRSKPSYLPDVEREEQLEEEEAYPSPPLPVAPVKELRLQAVGGGSVTRKAANLSQPASPTEGLADLPPPPPPTHSADHAERIRAFLSHQQQQRETNALQNRREDATLPLPPLPTPNSVASQQPPIPLSKSSLGADLITASSVAAYPTVSPDRHALDGVNAAGADLGSAPVAGKHAGRLTRMLNSKQIRRPSTTASEVNGGPRQRHSLAVEELVLDPLPKSKSTAGTRTSDMKLRRPRTAGDAPGFARRSRAMTLNSPAREGSFIVFSVRKGGQAVVPRSDGFAEPVLDAVDGQEVKKECGAMAVPVLDQPLQASPTPISCSSSGDGGGGISWSPVGAGRKRMQSLSSGGGVPRTGKEVGRGERSSFIDSMIPRAFSPSTGHNRNNSRGTENGKVDENSSFSAHLMKAVRRGKESRSAESVRGHSRRSSAVGRLADSEILQLEQDISPVMPWSGSSYFHSNASVHSFPQRSSPLVRGSVVGGGVDDLGNLSAMHIAESQQDGSTGSGEDTDQGGVGSAEGSGGKGRAMRFRSWLAWRGNRSKQRESEVEMERRMAVAEAEMRREYGELLSASSAGGRSNEEDRPTDRMTLGSDTSPQQSRSAGFRPFTLRSNASEYFGRLRHQQNPPAGQDPQTSDPHRFAFQQPPHTANPTGMAHSSSGGHRQTPPSLSEGSECLEEVATSNCHSDQDTDLGMYAPPPPPHSPVTHPSAQTDPPSVPPPMGMFRRIPASHDAAPYKGDDAPQFHFTSRHGTIPREKWMDGDGGTNFAQQSFGGHWQLHPPHDRTGPLPAAPATADQPITVHPSPPSNSRIFTGSFRGA